MGAERRSVSLSVSEPGGAGGVYVAACAVHPGLGGGPKGPLSCRGPYPTSVMTWEARGAEPGPGSVGAGACRILCLTVPGPPDAQFNRPFPAGGCRLTVLSSCVLTKSNPLPTTPDATCRASRISLQKVGPDLTWQDNPLDGGAEGAAGRRGTRTPTFHPAGVEAPTCLDASPGRPGTSPSLRGWPLPDAPALGTSGATR